MGAELLEWGAVLILVVLAGVAIASRLGGPALQQRVDLELDQPIPPPFVPRPVLVVTATGQHWICPDCREERDEPDLPHECPAHARSRAH